MDGWPGDWAGSEPTGEGDDYVRSRPLGTLGTSTKLSQFLQMAAVFLTLGDANNASG